MLNKYIVFNAQFYLTSLLVLTGIIGDYIVLRSKLHFKRALFDNATHAAIGAISWLIVSVTVKTRSSMHSVMEILYCTLLASFIDLDHFLAAQSFYLKDAISLQRRPPLHCSTFPLIFCIFVFCIGYLTRLRCLLNMSLITFVAFASHHTRDATRRGFWFYPFGSTPPISYLLYLIITAFIPYFIAYIQKHYTLRGSVNSSLYSYVI